MPATTPVPTIAPGPARRALPLIKLLLHNFSLLAAGGLASAFWYSLGDFAELFSSFGVNLPQVTRLLMEHQQLAWNILRCALAHQLIWLLLWVVLRERWAHSGLLLASLMTWLQVAALITAVYLPLLSLGQVV